MAHDLTFSRRALMSLGALFALEPGLEAQQQRPNEPPPQKITKDGLKQMLDALGLDFTEAERDMMLSGVNRTLSEYDRLRKIDVPLDTEPAFRFIPALPGKEPKQRKPVFQPSKAKAGAAPKNIEDLAFAPVTQLAALVRAKRVTSTALTKMYLDRLKKYGPKLTCVITLTEDLALEQAKQADAEIRRGKYRGPLHGIPYGAKDLFATKGIKTTWGAEPYQDQMIDYDATVISRLHDAGAVLLAKLSMGALAQGGLWFGGMTKTPWNIEQTSSGSSAGSASATASGLVGFSLGTETLGSIVSPSIRCGTTGLRPTYGRISRYGAMGLSWTMDKVGPICRSVEDCALVLNAVYGPDGHDGTVLNAPFDWQPRQPLGKLRVGLLNKEFERATGDRKKMYDDAIAALRKAGVNFVNVDPPSFDPSALRSILTAEAAAAFDDLTRSGGVRTLKGQAANDWPNTFRSARVMTAVEYIRAMRARTLLMREWDTFMENWDVLVSTPFQTLLPTNLTGHPQVVVPCGFINGMPDGIVFTGKLYQEGMPLRLAHAFQSVTKWHEQHPKMDWV
jgi:Asp-tRNA(Asn)/Glu-tRNA(Gln) amidotransferase A subunit family amidase